MESKDSKTPKDEEKDNEKEKYQIEIIGEQYKEYDFSYIIHSLLNSIIIFFIFYLNQT